MKKVIFVSLLFIGLMSQSIAQSPVTLTSFYSNYSQLENIETILKMGVLDNKSAYFLMEDNNPIDQKAAIINALVESDKDAENATTFTMFVARKYGVDFQTLDLNLLTADELFSLAYLTIMDEKGSPELAIPIFEKALEKNSESYTIQFFNSLAKAQQSVNQKDNCSAWKAFSETASNTTFKNDLNASIKNEISNAMNPYKEDCE